ncbi:MAG: ABC transporter ATP-binding protein [Mesorhizobium sp.]
MTGSAEIILDVRDLCVDFGTGVRVLDGVNLQVRKGEILGIVGESGSGKSVTSMTIMGLLDPPGRITGGSVLFEGADLSKMNDRQLREMRGNRLAMIFQDPMATLNPVLRVDTQMIETVLAHQNVSRKEARQRSIAALARVGIPSPEERMLSYPHEFSGGMRQRVAIAIALLHEPSLIIADEATTALDVTIQAQILSEAQALVRETGTSFIWVTHDLSVVSSLADRIAVMYAGRIVEQGPVDKVLAAPRHPYTAGLLGSIPSANKRGEALRFVPGSSPTPDKLPSGCVFSSRCDRVVAQCDQRPDMSEVDTGHLARCYNPLTAGLAR